MARPRAPSDGTEYTGGAGQEQYGLRFCRRGRVSGLLAWVFGRRSHLRTKDIPHSGRKQPRLVRAGLALPSFFADSVADTIEGQGKPSPYETW